MIKDLVVNLTVDGRRDPAPDFAISIGKLFSANLVGMAFAHELVISPRIIAGMPAEFIQSIRAQSEKAAHDTIARFTDAAGRAGVSVESKMLTTTYVGAAEFFGRMARTFDIAVVGQAEPDKAVPEDMIVENTLFESGRPIVVVPYIQKEPIKLDRIMVCWDGSRAAARAVGDAMPFFAHAKIVEVVTVKDKDEPDEPPATAEDFARHLAHHDLKTKIHRLVAADVKVSEMLLSHAADSSADFMVMGGYGHSRLREFFLGGVTRGILASMTVPTLMSH